MQKNNNQPNLPHQYWWQRLSLIMYLVSGLIYIPPIRSIPLIDGVRPFPERL